MKLKRFFINSCFLLLVFFALTITVQAQRNYPKGYFTWPVQAKPELAANFGELRPNHYHMGLDCKTNKKENLPVLAAAEGFIARVKIEPYGFGRAIYIQHPNGLTTLYAHLNDFMPELESYIKEQQYLQKKWKIIVDIPPGKFQVTKGQFIANSGNTGGSQGPHLHFEVRDTKTDKVLNPLLFGFPIPDQVPPTIQRLAMYDRCVSTYEQKPQFINLKKIPGGYTTAQPVLKVNTDRISFALGAFDTYTGSSNPNGIYKAVLYDNEKAVLSFELDSIGYDETRYMNAHIDYKCRFNKGPFLQHVSKLSGYPQGVYQEFTGDGVISLEDDSVHIIKIDVYDANGNKSVVKLSVQRNFAKVIPETDSLAVYRTAGFHPHFINVFENSSIRFYLPENALYDSIRFTYGESIAADHSKIYRIHNPSVPVHSYYNISIRTGEPDNNKMVMHRFYGSSNDYCKAEPVTTLQEKGWYRGQFREFGFMQLLVDSTAPAITALGFRDGMNCAKSTHLKFLVLDNTEEITDFTATLDGNWLRFSNDKGRVFVYKFDEHCAPGQHELKITATDQVGNTTEKIFHFTR